MLHLGFLARVLTGLLEASAAREANSTADRLRVLSRPSAAAVASLLARLPPESARRQRLDGLARHRGVAQVPGLDARTATVRAIRPEEAEATLVAVEPAR